VVTQWKSKYGAATGRSNMQNEKLTDMPGTGAITFDARRILQGPFLSRGQVGIEGRVYLATDSVVASVDNGVIQPFQTLTGSNTQEIGVQGWTGFGPIFPLRDPNLFSWQTNGFSQTFNANGKGLLQGFQFNNSTASNLNYYVKALPSSPPYTIDFLVSVSLSYQGPNSAAGVGWADGSGNAVINVLNQNSGAPYGLWGVQKWNGVGGLLGTPTFNASYSIGDPGTYPIGGQYFWIRLFDNGTNRVCKFSYDGINYQSIFSVSDTDFITPANVIVGVSCGTSSTLTQTGIVVLSYHETPGSAVTNGDNF
jgi:hypothetical protein